MSALSRLKEARNKAEDEAIRIENEISWEDGEFMRGYAAGLETAMVIVVTEPEHGDE